MFKTYTNQLQIINIGILYIFVMNIENFSFLSLVAIIIFEGYRKVFYYGMYSRYRKLKLAFEILIQRKVP